MKKNYYLLTIIGLLTGYFTATAQTWKLTPNGEGQYIEGKIGIGTDTPISPLSFGKDGGIYIPSNNNASNYITTGADNNFLIQGSEGIQFWTYYNTWSPKLSIAKNGNIGIGTTSPISPLSFGKDGGIYMPSNNNASNYITTGADNNFLIQGGDGIQFWTHHNTWSPKLSIAENGNIGIGTTSPISPLSFGKDGGIYMPSNNNASNYITTGSDNNFLIQGGDGIQFWTHHNTWSPKLSIAENGNIGIGTTSPAYKLAVKGTIGCGEIKVENVSNWADFVFEPDYNLRSIEEVESYIKENKHLPDIPSEKEVKEEGISVGEMNTKLLQKIEEQMLYIIELEKRIEKLENDK
jgi:hypothetical protein